MRAHEEKFSTAYWLSLPSMLLSIVPPFEPEGFFFEDKAAMLERWRRNGWPAVHFFPESQAGEADFARCATYRGLVRPGACLVGSPLLSPWSSERFTNLHHDIGSPPLIVVGGELDRSVLATAVGAAERNTPVTVVTASAVCGRFHGTSAASSREAIRSILRSFALEASAAEVLAATAGRLD